MTNNRIEWIDIAKGITIYLMVIGHTSIPHCISDFIWSFHMPFFFMISGLMFTPSKADNYKRYLERKAKTMIIPYLFFLLCNMWYLWIWGMEIPLSMFTIGDKVGAYWFLQVLFPVVLINALTIKYAKKKWIYLVCCILLSLVSYTLYKLNIHLPYRLEVIGIASLYYGIGYILSSYIRKWEVPYYITFIIITIVFVAAQFLPRLDLNYNIMGWYIPNIALACLGSIMIMLIAKKLSNWQPNNIIKRILLWMGGNSIIIMGLSQPINMSLKYTLNYFALPHSISFCIQHILLWLFLFAISYILTQYTPILIGKK